MSIQRENSGSIPSAPIAAKTSTMSIISLVMGILGWFLIPLVGGIIAVVSGHIARNEIKKSGGSFTGDGMAIAGLVLGYTNVVCMILFAVLWVTVFSVVMSQM